MDYEKKYKEALEWARKVMQGKVGFVLDEVLEKFPELKESEDERMRNVAINACKYMVDNFENSTKQYEDAISWLEKQGKNNMGISESVKQKLEDNLSKALEKETPESWNKFLDEQNPGDKVEPKFKVGDWVVNTITNAIEQVIEVTEHDYICSGLLIVSFNEQHLLKRWTIEDAKDGDVLTTDLAHFILKSKDNMSCYMYCNYSVVSNNFGTSDTAIVDSKYVHPATKEQCDLLFQKITEAGYEWDAEKKKLKKIKQKPTDEEMKIILQTEYEKGRADAIAEMQKPVNIDYISGIRKELLGIEDNAKNINGLTESQWVAIRAAHRLLGEYMAKEQNPAWSEEDERNMNIIVSVVRGGTHLAYENVLDWFTSLKYRVQPQIKQEWSEEEKKKIDNILNVLIDYKELEPEYFWLKSLKERYAWKKSLATAGLENSLCDIQDGYSDTSYEYRILGEAIEFIRCTEPQPHWKPSDEKGEETKRIKL